jgi:hypothetical protein
MDGLSDLGFEDEDEDEDMEGTDEVAAPSKKRKV